MNQEILKRLNEIDLEIYDFDCRLFSLKSEKAKLLSDVGSSDNTSLERLALALSENVREEKEEIKINQYSEKYQELKKRFMQTETFFKLQVLVKEKKFDFDKPSLALIYSKNKSLEKELAISYFEHRYKAKNYNIGLYSELDLIESNSNHFLVIPKHEIILYDFNFLIQEFTPSLLTTYTNFFGNVLKYKYSVIGFGNSAEKNEKTENLVSQVFQNIILI
jgi:hypothetical protein